MGNGSEAVRVLSVAVLAAMTAVALAACTAGKRSEQRPAAELVLYEDLEYAVYSFEEAKELALSFRVPELAKQRKIKPETLEFFRNSKVGQAYLKKWGHRALAFGHPAKSCPYYQANWKREWPQEAIVSSLVRCLIYVQQIETLTGEKCGCRIAGVDNGLFGAAEGFRRRSLLPTMIFRAPIGTDDYALKQTGFLDLNGRLGRDIPVRFLDGKGDDICLGAYTAREPGYGTMSFWCRDESGIFKGKYRVLGFFEGREYGVAIARSEKAKFAALFGLSEKTFTERWRELAERLKF